MMETIHEISGFILFGIVGIAIAIGAVILLILILSWIIGEAAEEPWAALFAFLVVCLAATWHMTAPEEKPKETPKSLTAPLDKRE